MPQRIRAMTPASTVHASPDTYSARGDGFLVVDITDEKATCEMRGFDSTNNVDNSSNMSTRWSTDISLSQ